jgi:hypothetical protein
MSKKWKDISTAPKNKVILLWGHIDPDIPNENFNWSEPSIFTGYWDEIDQAWCCSGSTWIGPFMKCYFWRELPKKPKIKS